MNRRKEVAPTSLALLEEGRIMRAIWQFLATESNLWIVRFLFVYALVFFAFRQGIELGIKWGFLFHVTDEEAAGSRAGAFFVWPIFMATTLIDIYTRATSPTESKKRITTYVIATNIVGICTYLTIQYGWIPPLAGFLNRPIHAARYIEWIMATPTLIVVVSELDTENLRSKQIRAAIYYDIAMQVTGFFSGIAHATFWYSFWLTISCVCFFPVVYNNWILFNNAIGNSVLADDVKKLRFLRNYTMVEWSVFPFVFIFAFADILPISSESYIWCVLDLGAKVVYSLTLLNSSFWSVQQFKRIAESNNESVITNASETSARIHEFQAMLDAAVFDKNIKHTPIGRMSHELREPLSNIIAFNSLLMESEISYEQTKLVSYAITSADSLLSTINNITEFMESEEKGVRPSDGQFDLLRVLEQVATSISWKEKFKSTNFIYEYTRDCPALIEGDAALLYQTLVNTVDNALRGSASNKIVRLKVQAMQLKNLEERTLRDSAGPEGPEDEEVMMRFTIISEGPPIETELTSVFTPFRKTQIGGDMGLGMVVAKRVVEAMGGILTVSSNGQIFFPALEPKYQLKEVGGEESASSESDNQSDDDEPTILKRRQHRAGKKKDTLRRRVDRGKYRNFLRTEVKKRLREGCNVHVAMEDIDVSHGIKPMEDVWDNTDKEPFLEYQASEKQDAVGIRYWLDIPFKLVRKWRQEVRLRNSRPLEGSRVFLLISDKVVNEAVKAKLSEWGAFCSDDATLLLDGSGYCWFHLIIKDAGSSDSIYEWFLAAAQRTAAKNQTRTDDIGESSENDILLGEKTKRSKSAEPFQKPYVIVLGRAAKELDRRKRKRERDHLTTGGYEWEYLQYPIRWNGLLLAIFQARRLSSAPLITWIEEAHREPFVTTSPTRSSLAKMLRDDAQERADPRTAVAATSSLIKQNMSILDVPLPSRSRSGDKISGETMLSPREDASGSSVPDTSSAPLIHVLMVDDMPINIRVATSILTRLRARKAYAGLKWESAKNGKEGLEKVIERAAIRPYDVVLMDVQMPLMNGYEATRAIRRLERTGELKYQHKIVAMTSDKEDEVRAACLEAGMDVYLTKPLASRDLEVMMGLYFGHLTSSQKHLSHSYHASAAPAAVATTAPTAVPAHRLRPIGDSHSGPLTRRHQHHSSGGEQDNEKFRK
eukprot:TRINITY_DN4931_c0_g1_i1.p1 TRINITY_DN4931_c0_g1~~TRINITY_DN4931_c0_g1_i1.p1  ORF type:complete len:1167 (-),score=163.62 TRINITY_DN4931_c0_g1_i1:224-3724(-)